MATKVLIIEDEEPLRKRAAEVAEGRGYIVDTVQNEAEAYRYLRTRPSVDVILADIDLVGEKDREDRGGTRIAEAISEEQHPVAIVATSSRFSNLKDMLGRDVTKSSPFHDHSDKKWITNEDKRDEFFGKVTSALNAVREALASQQEKIDSLIGGEARDEIDTSEGLLPNDDWNSKATMTNTEFFILDGSDFRSLGDAKVLQPIPVWVRVFEMSGKTLHVAEVYKLPAVRVMCEQREDVIPQMAKLIQRLITVSSKDGDEQDLYNFPVAKALGKYINLA